MNYYELTYLIPSDLTEEEIGVFSEKINSLIQEEGGILDKSLEEKKRKLGYPIEKKMSAFLRVLTFHIKPEKLKSLEKKIKEKKEILRYLLLNKKESKTPKAVPRILRKPLSSVPKPKAKVELKDIEKKLEEILEE